MKTPLPPATLTLLEKTAVDNGFDRDLPRQGDWSGFASTRVPLRVWLGAAPDVPALHRLVRRAFQLSRTLPDELLNAFRRKTAGLPASTEAERLVVQRVGQDLFRAGLIDYWDGRCAMTGLAVPELLRASHIRPWADCATDAERLDVFNGLLLASHLDAAFDRGLITVGDDGAVMVSSLLDSDARRVLGFDAPLRIRLLEDAHRAYLPWHRERVFRKGSGSERA